MLHKAINMREAINIKNAEENDQTGNSYSTKKVYFSEIRNLALYLGTKAKSANLFSIGDHTQEDENEGVLHDLASL